MLSQVHNGVVRASRTSRVPLSSLGRTTTATFLLPSVRPCTRILQQHSLSSLSTSQVKSRDLQPKARSFATLPETRLPKDIAVLGGGLTGLTTAYYLTRFHPDANITIYEADDRLGGWVDTEKISVKTQDGKDATISFERGARTVAPQSDLGRWEDFVLYDMIDQLGLLKNPETTPYAIPKFGTDLTNRYVYYPDHLVKMPGPSPPNASGLTRLFYGLKLGYTLVTEPLFKGGLKAWLSYGNKQKAGAEAYKRRQSSTRAIADFNDVSVGDYLEGLFGSRLMVNNIASAFFHGVWGGDVWKLSAPETTMQTVYFQNEHSGQGLIPVKDHDYDSCLDIFQRNRAVFDVMQRYGQSIYIGFHNGFHTLSDAVADALRKNPKVTIKTGTSVTAIKYESAEGKAVVESTAETHRYDKVISSLYSGTLANLTGDSLPALKNSTAVTIQIVNLWYPDPNLLSRNPGFGYLIPQSVPAEQNPHAALGVIFDSDRDKVAGTPEYTNAPGTKLTVMLGGHYWDSFRPDQLPNADEAVAMAIDTVERQLRIPSTTPVYTSTKVCRECIPQHVVGHRPRMAQAHTELYNAFRGTLAVVGGSYTSPGVLPTLKAARDIALKVAGQGYKALGDKEPESSMVHVGETGLGRFYGRNEMLRFYLKMILPFRGFTKSLHDLPKQQVGGPQ